MCGIVGVFSIRSGTGDLGASVLSMTKTLRHRGPDEQGLWVSPCRLWPHKAQHSRSDIARAPTYAER